jgi:hypothetical protein
MDALIEKSEQAARTILLGNCGSAHSAEGNAWKQTLEHREEGASFSLVVYWAAGPNGCSNNRFKGVCEMAHAPSTVWACLHDNEKRHLWDRNISRVTALCVRAGAPVTEGGAPERACIVHSQTRNVGIIAGRDFVDLPVFLSFEDGPSAPTGPDGFVAPKGTLVSGGAGIEDARYPPAAGFVRGWNSPGSGWVLEPVPQPGGAVHTRVHYLIHTDLKGWIPTMLINSSLAVSVPAPHTPRQPSPGALLLACHALTSLHPHPLPAPLPDSNPTSSSSPT